MKTTKEQNKALCKKYPFLIPRNRLTDEVTEDYDYDYTELDAMPDGWRKSFGEKMCSEIMNELIAEDFVNEYRIIQIKEKYGGLRWYSNGSKAIDDIIRKYEGISFRTCIQCGEPATRMTTGWISPYCDNCCPTTVHNVPIDDYFEEALSEGNNGWIIVG